MEFEIFVMDRIIKIYDSSVTFELKGKTLEAQYVELGIQERLSLSCRKVDEVIKCRVLDSLKYVQGDFLSKCELKRIKKALIYRGVIECTEKYEKYIHILEELHNIGSNKVEKYLPLSDEAGWKKAMAYLKWYVKRNTFQKGLAKKSRNKEINRANAALRLKEYGVEVRIKNNDLEFEETCNVTNIISDMVKQIGGVRFVEALLASFPFNTDTGRLEPIKQGNIVIPLESDTSYPFGYLLNIGFRHIAGKGSDENLKKYFCQVIQLAQDYCMAVYPVLNCHILDDMHHRGEDATAYFKRLTILDSIYYIQQNNKDLSIEIYSYLIDKLIDGGYELLDEELTLKEYKDAMKEIAQRSANKEFIRVNVEDIKTIACDNRKKKFLRLVSNYVNNVNSNYEGPLDYDKVNYSDAPLILLSNKEALLYPSTIGVGGWYEKMMTLLREKDNDKQSRLRIDSFVGMKLEEFMRQKFAKKGIETKYGKYVSNGLKGECDIVVETDNRVFLMEMKKKNLTRAARQGHEYQIVMDLTSSLYYSQEQCFRTKMALMKNGQVVLSDNGNSVILEYKERPIESITLTLNDYGSFQERILLMQILELFTRCSFSVRDEDVDATELDEGIKKMIKEGYITLAKKQKKLNEFLCNIYKMELKKTPKMEKKSFNPFFDSWFLNIEQLCYLLKISIDLNDFEKNLKKIKCLTYGTRDFWTELPLKLGFQVDCMYN